MPIYEYQCEKCKKHHEVTQKITDAPLTKCPECKGKLKKLISLAGFQLKGGGWYKDGYSSPKTEAPTKPAESTPNTSAAADTPVSKPTSAESEKKTKGSSRKKAPK